MAISIPLIGALGDLAIKGWRTVFGDKREQDRYQSDARTQIAANYAAEFLPRANRTKWDSFWDGMNRAPRPMMVILVVAYFVTAWWSPAEFARINAGLATVPAPMWATLGAIIGFYFAAREFKYSRDTKAFAQAAQAAQALAQQKAPAALPGPDTVNPSIVAWRAQAANRSPAPARDEPTSIDVWDDDDW